MLNNAKFLPSALMTSLLLGGCATLGFEDDLADKAEEGQAIPVFGEEDINRYFSEWSSSMEKINSLSEMESDLSLLIAELNKLAKQDRLLAAAEPAISLQRPEPVVETKPADKPMNLAAVESDSNTQMYANTAKTDMHTPSAHGQSQDMQIYAEQMIKAEQTLPLMSESGHFVAHIGYFINPKAAQAEWKRINTRYQFEDYGFIASIAEVHQPNRQLLSLRMGAFSSQNAASLFCTLLGYSGHSCDAVDAGSRAMAAMSDDAETE